MPPEKSRAKTSVEDRLLGSIDLIDAAQACALLRIDADDPDATMQSMVRDGAIITLAQNGKAVFPRFQIDMANGRIFPVVGAILKLRPACLSNLMLCYWLTRAHVDFGCAPAQRFGHDDAAIVAAFRRYVERVRHG